MKPLRNNNPLLPLQPEPAAPTASRPATLTEVQWWKRLLFLERKRNGKVETILTRTITNLEQQVSDLRSAYFANLTLRHNTENK